MTEDDLFKGSAKQFTTEAKLLNMVHNDSADKELLAEMVELQGQNGVDVAEIIASHLERLAKIHNGHALYAAVDEAKSIDSTVLHVIKDRRRDLKGGVKGIAIDTTRGDWLADWFEKNTNYYVKRVKFSRPSKSLMYSNLQIIIEDGLTSLPQWKEGKEWVSDESKHFFNQMISLEKEIIGGLLVVHHPKGSCNSSDHNYDECPYHDDHPDTWMMAEDLYVEFNGVPKRAKKDLPLTVPNQVAKLLERGRGRMKKRYGVSGFE